MNPWHDAINVPDEELDEDEQEFDLENLPPVIYLTKSRLLTIVALAVVGAGTLAYIAGKTVEKLLDK